MDVFVWAQIIGFIGYLFLIYAPHLPTKQKIMQFELLACCILTFQWFLLGQPVLMFSNMIGIVSLAVALSRLDPRCKNFLFLALYPLSLLFMAYIWQGTLLDVLTIIALIGSISRAVSTACCFPWVSGACAGHVERKLIVTAFERRVAECRRGRGGQYARGIRAVLSKRNREVE